MVRYYGYYSNVSRGKRKKADADDKIPCILEPELTDMAFRKNWARLIQKIYEVDPLRCPKCQGLYVDEFQTMATPTFASILSEARKYKLALTLANQYASQISENIINGIFGNIGTLISFRVGLKDAEMISGEFGQQVSQNDLMGLSNYTAYIRLLIDGAKYSPFNIRTILPETKEDPKLVEEICKLSRKKYGRPIKEVDDEIHKAWETGN